MSAFDEERKKLGLLTSNKNSTTSAFDNDRMDLGLIKDTRTKPEVKKTETKKEISKTQADANVNTKVSDTLKGKVPAASLLTTPNSFGNNAVTEFSDKVPAASLLTAGTGGPSNASKIKGTSGNSQYDTTKNEIENSGAPGAVKAYANAMNYITQGNPVGKAISRSFAGNSGATSRDSTGNKTVDKVTDVINNLVTPFITPTGAPVGQGIIGSTYDATGRALSGKVGQSVLKGAGKVIPGSDDVVRVAATEGLAGGLQGVGFGLQQGQDSGNEIARNALYGAAAGGVLGGVGAALGEGISAGLSKIMKRKNIPDAEVAATLEEILTPKTEVVPKNQVKTNLPETNPLALPQSPERLALPESSYKPTTARVERQTNVYRQKFEDLIAEAQKRSFSPGREDIELENLWGQMAERNDPGLDELISLAYPKRTNTLQKGMVQAARANQEMREVAGIGNPVKSTAPQVFSDAAAPRQVLGRKGTTGTVKEAPVRTTELTREQQIQAKVDAGEFLPQEDLDYIFSGQYDHAKAFPEETPTKSTYAKPKKIVTEISAQPVSKAAEAPIPTKSLVDPVVAPKQVVKPKETLSVEPVAEVKAPVVTQRGFTETLKASEKTPSQVKANLNNEYTPITNLDTVQKANARLKADAETSRVLSAKKFDAEDSVVAQRLIDHYNKQGNYEMSVTIADKVAEEATKAGQFIQSLSIYDRLTPEGVLIRAKRIEKRVNETASKIGKAAKVTDDMAKDIVDLAGVTQKMTGVKDLSNNVIDILERAKKGETLTSNEASQLERFVKESKQFIKETTKPQKSPKSPTTIKDKRVRDNVTSFLDAQEQAAKARLKAKGVRISSTPLDVWADYAVIGAAKMGKNIVKFADWSEQMVKDLGEDIRPNLNQLYESSKEAFNLTSKKISRQTISEAERLTQKVIKEKELSVPEAESLLKIAQRVSSLSGEAKRTASQDLQAILQSLDKPSFLRKVASAQTQAQLLNPKTQVRNVLGNELFYRLERLNKYVATPIDIARSVLTGADRTVTFRSNNQGQYWYNFINGAKAGWKGVNINGLETQFDLASPAFTGKYNPLKYTEKALGASLRSFDNAAYSRAVNKSLGELGTLDAINKGVKPTKEYIKNYIAQADENIIQIADHYGKYVTFQDNNIISKGLTGLKKGFNVGKDFGFGDLVLKYPKTPGALLMRALEYSPAGFLRSAKIVAEPLLRNGIQKNPAEATQALSRAIIGTFGLSGLGYFLIDNDILTGQANKDRDIRSLQTAAGQGQYQVNLSALYRFVSNNFDPSQAKIKEGDLLYNYDWMQPVSVAVSMGANINKNLGEGKDTTTGVLSSAYNSISGGLNTLTEQSVLQGLARAAEGYPGQTVTDKIADILSDIPASFVPTILNQVKQATDNTKRETTDQTLLEQTLNKAQAKIPGLAGKLPKKYDTLGNEQNHYQDNNAVNVFLNPGFPSRYKLSDEARMIVDLITETGDEGLAPRVPNKKLDGSKLTGEQFSRLSKLQGDKTKERLGKVKESLSTKSKVKKIKGQLTKSTAEAKKQLSKEFPELKVSK